jgi:hypothetical protein
MGDCGIVGLLDWLLGEMGICIVYCIWVCILTIFGHVPHIVWISKSVDFVIFWKISAVVDFFCDNSIIFLWLRHCYFLFGFFWTWGCLTNSFFLFILFLYVDDLFTWWLLFGHHALGLHPYRQSKYLNSINLNLVWIWNVIHRKYVLAAHFFDIFIYSRSILILVGFPLDLGLVIAYWLPFQVLHADE